MNQRSRPHSSMILIPAFCMIGALYALYLASTINQFVGMHASTHAHVMTATQELPQSDFARFWYVGKIFLIQRASDIGVHIKPSAWFTSTFHLDILSPTIPPGLVWLYPPTMELLAILFGAVPLTLSFWLWQIFSVGIAALALRLAELPWFAVIAGLCSPAAMHNFIGGQNGVLTGGLLVAALMMMDQRPVRAGWIAGLLCIKPQIAVGLPAVLLMRSRVKSLLACGGAVCALVLLSDIVVGRQSWHIFFTLSQPSSMRLLTVPFRDAFQPAGFTVFLMARSFEVNLAESWCLQGICSILSMIFIWRCWRQPMANTTARMAFTVCLSLLITPYGYAYDLVGFSIAMAALFARAPAWQQIILGFAWLFSGYTITWVNVTGMIIMPLVIATGAAVAWSQLQQTDAAQTTA